MCTDRPKQLGDAAVLRQRLGMLHEPHIAPITRFVEKLRGRMDANVVIPYADPRDGGVNADVLFLLEAPGPRASSSGFVSRDNPDETAKNLFELCQEVGLDRSRMLLWNIVPWYIGSKYKIRPANPRDIATGMTELEELLGLLPRLKAVVLVGAKAQKAEENIREACPDVRVFRSPHPSPQFVNRKLENRGRLKRSWQEVGAYLFAQSRPHLNHTKFQSSVKALYAAVEELEAMFPGRHFTPDGHMVGSIGECLVADAYQLELMPASNKGFDAMSKCGKQVEIKATQGSSVAFRSQPEHVIAIKIFPDGRFEEIYNGPGSLVWQQFEGRPRPSNGQYQISLRRLRELHQKLGDSDRLPRADGGT